MSVGCARIDEPDRQYLTRSQPFRPETKEHTHEEDRRSHLRCRRIAASAFGSAGAGPLSTDAGLTAAKPPLVTPVCQGADDRVNRKLKRHGQGLDDGPNDVRHSSSSSSSSPRGRGSDDPASHQRNGGDDHGGDNRGGRGGGDDNGGDNRGAPRGGDDNGGRH